MDKEADASLYGMCSAVGRESDSSLEDRQCLDVMSRHVGPASDTDLV